MSTTLHILSMPLDSNMDRAKKGSAGGEQRPLFDPRLLGPIQPNPYANPIAYNFVQPPMYPSHQVIQFPHVFGFSPSPAGSVTYANPFAGGMSTVQMMPQFAQVAPMAQLSNTLRGPTSANRLSEAISSSPADTVQTGGRVRSTLQMTNFLAAQMRQYNFFKPPKNKEERIQVRRSWDRALRDFNQKFDLSVSLTAYRRKVSHLRRTSAWKHTGSERQEESDDGDIAGPANVKRFRDMGSSGSDGDANTGDDEATVSTPPPQDRKKPYNDDEKEFDDSESSE